MIENRSPVFEAEGGTLEIVQGQEETFNSYVVSPIIANGDPIGCVIMIARDGDVLTKVEQKTIETAANFLAKQME